MDRIPTSTRPTRIFVTVGLAWLLSGCATTPPPVGVSSLPPIMNVSEWPHWLDIPLDGSADYERMWRTTIDIVSERHALSTIDKEAGYLRTEWRPSADRSHEARYTLRIRPDESRIRMGIEVRLLPSLSQPRVLYNRPDTPWTSVYNELRQRLSGF
jgi:hypothetical protein